MNDYMNEARRIADQHLSEPVTDLEWANAQSGAEQEVERVVALFGEGKGAVRRGPVYYGLVVADVVKKMRMGVLNCEASKIDA